jgi:deoxyribonuclease V
MDCFELKREQTKLAPKIVLQDDFSKLQTVAGVACVPIGDKLLAYVVVLDMRTLQIKEKQSCVLDNPLPYRQGFLAYREMPAIIEAYNKLEEEPDMILVAASGILHPRRLGMASHLGLALNKATIGFTLKPMLGNVEQGKVMANGEFLGFEVKTREHANPLYVSPGHFVSFGTALRITEKTIVPPHKMPEPLHIAHKLAKRKVKEMRSQ